jgi:hypothetical protein
MRLKTIARWLGILGMMSLPFGLIPGLRVTAETHATDEGESVLPKAPPVTCTIRSEPTCRSGSAPTVAVEIANWTGSDIYLIGSLDGSDLKWRYPLCYFEVIGPNGRPAQPRIARCGNMNAIREKDFVKVPPGGKFDPYQTIDEYGFFGSSQLTAAIFPLPGRYRIRLIYSTDQADAKCWLGDSHGNRSEMLNTGRSDEAIIKLLDQVPKTTVSSNEITVQVLPSD